MRGLHHTRLSALMCDRCTSMSFTMNIYSIIADQIFARDRCKKVALERGHRARISAL